MIDRFEWLRYVNGESLVGGRLVRYAGDERHEGVIERVEVTELGMRFFLRNVVRGRGQESEFVDPVDFFYNWVILMFAQKWADGVTFPVPCVGRVDISFCRPIRKP